MCPSKGSRIQVKGIPDVARHTSVTVVPCQDADNFEYPKGLLCAAEKGGEYIDQLAFWVETSNQLAHLGENNDQLAYWGKNDDQLAYWGENNDQLAYWGKNNDQLAYWGKNNDQLAY